MADFSDGQFAASLLTIISRISYFEAMWIDHEAETIAFRQFMLEGNSLTEAEFDAYKTKHVFAIKAESRTRLPVFADLFGPEGHSAESD